MVTSDKKTITSPFYPDFYPNYQKCRWMIIAPIGHVVGYVFNDFHLGSEDFVEVESGQISWIRYTSSGNKPVDFWRTSTDTSLWVIFKSYSHFTFRGFEMKVKFFKTPEGTRAFFYFNRSIFFNDTARH